MADRLLGEGSYGTVYDNMDGTVTKYLNIMYVGEESRMHYISQDAIAEPCALKRLKECGVPYIVDLKNINVNSNNRAVKITLEKCIELPQIISNSEVVRKMVAQLFIAIEGMHQLDVYHGDIKTENIMIDPASGDVRVIDFSLAHVDFPILSYAWEELYTLGYRPPEILLEAKHFDRAKADVWAAGVTACELILGRRRMMQESSLKSSTCETMIHFGDIKHGSFYPGWSSFISIYNINLTKNGRVYDIIKGAANGSEIAADFIRCACNPTPGDRWTARRLLDHPYIQDITSACDARKQVYQLQRVVIRDRPMVNRLFSRQRNAERELLTDELLRKLGYSRDDDRAYIGAMNICSTYRLEDIIPAYTDIDAIADMLRRPETFELLSKHIFVQNIDNTDF